MAEQVDCLCAGILFVDYVCDPIRRLPKSGELLRTEGITIALGGCASNTAIDLAKLGVNVGVAGCVGADASGQLVRSTLAQAGADVSGIRSIDAAAAAAVRHASSFDMTRTSGTVVINVEGDDRRFISTPGANDAFCADDIPSHWANSAKVFYVGGYLMMPGVEDESFVDLLRRMRARGCRTILDVVLMSDDAAHFANVLERSLPHTDIFMPNDDEAQVMTGLSEPMDQAKWFRDHGANDVCITLGSRGTLFVSDRHVIRCGVYPTTFVGGTGSGDAFDAGFIAAILAGKSDEDALRWGSALGASCVRSLTASGSVFTRPELLEFLDRHELSTQTIS